MLFTFPSRYWSTIGLTGVFSLAGWSRRIRAGFLVSRVTQDTTGPRVASHTGLSPSMAVLSRTFRSRRKCRSVVLLPRHCIATAPVWAAPLSLATTRGIILIFSSYGYLDVSVPHVRPSYAGDGPSARRVAPFGHPRINGYLLLPVAFRSLSRPSSPP